MAGAVRQRRSRRWRRRRARRAPSTSNAASASSAPRIAGVCRRAGSHRPERPDRARPRRISPTINVWRRRQVRRGGQKLEALKQKLDALNRQRRNTAVAKSHQPLWRSTTGRRRRCGRRSRPRAYVAAVTRISSTGLRRRSTAPPDSACRRFGNRRRASERHTGKVGAVLGEGRRGLADQRARRLWLAVGPDAVRRRPGAASDLGP